MKVTYLPVEYIKTRRRNQGLRTELAYLRAKARELNIEFNGEAKHSDIYYEIMEKMKDRGSDECRNVIETLRNEKMEILKEAQVNSHELARWLYENQGEMRFGSENRLFLVLVDTDDFDGSWKLKRNMDLLKPEIDNYLDNFSDKQLDELRISFRYKGKPQTFTALTDVIFVIK